MLKLLVLERLVPTARWAGVLLGMVALTADAQTPTSNDGYEPSFDGNVYALAMQSDGKVVVGGQFSSFRDRAGFSHRRRNIARLNSDGTLDESFDPDASAPVRALRIQPDGRILAGGDFTTLQPNGAVSASTRNRLARLHPDGTVDEGFDPNLGGFLQPQVFALVLQSDGRVVVGGSFTTVQPNGAASPFNRSYLARLHPDGSLDLDWDPHPNSAVLALALHADDKLVVGGGFTSFWESGSPEPSNRFRLARLNPNGTLDSEFALEVNNAVNALAVQRDGKIIVGGSFTTFKHYNDEGVANRSYLGRLNRDGTVDSEFYPLVNGFVTQLAVSADGGFLVGGNFTAAWSRGTTLQIRNYVARFHPDGILDTGFNPGVNSTVSAFAFQPDGKFILGGYFTRVQPAGSPTGLVRNHIARFNRNGTLDSDFKLNDGGRILASVVQSDGKIVVAGSFTNIGGVEHNYLARLNADGTVDHDYAPDFNGRVYTLAYEPGSGKVIAGGSFTEIGGETRNFLARLNPIGTIDSEFNPNIDGQVGVVALQLDGKILVGGSFSTVQPIGYTEAIPRSNLLRLNSDGSLDASFDPYPNSTVTTLVLQPDNQILVGGLFTTLAPGYTTNSSASVISQGYLARLKPDGTVDTDFKPTLGGQVSAMVLQPDGRLLIGGAFTTVIGSDGKLVTATNADGTTSDVAPTRNHLARLQPNGDLDFSYDPNLNNNVLAIALQADGKAIVGGAFTTLQPNSRSDWQLRKYIARIHPDGLLDESFDLDVSEEPGNGVDSLLLLPAGELLIGGRFTSLQPKGSAERVLRTNYVRILADTQVDVAFNPGAGGPAGGTISALVVQADDKVIAVGDFSDLGGAKTTNIARFRPEGDPDATFSTTLRANGPINSIIVRPINTVAASQLAGFGWLERDGALHTDFAPSGPAAFSGQVRAIARERDGSLLMGGSFSDLSNNYTGNLARYRPDGTLDTSFQPVINGAVTGIAVQNDGRIVIVGAFTSVDNVARNYIARIDADGALDITFDPAANGSINTVVIQEDGKIVVGGTFTTFYLNSTDDEDDDEDNNGTYEDDDEDDDDDNVSRSYLARINVDGTIDKDYYPTPNGAVTALALFIDGKVIVGGTFTTLQPNGGESVFGRNFLARINTDGTLDQNFDPSANSTIHAIVVEPDGQIAVGGEFTAFQPFVGDSTVPRNYVARINSDSTVDLTFDPNANGVVRTIALQSDGALLLGGSFTTLQPNESDDAITRNFLARVKGDGSIDFEYNPDVDAVVYALVTLPDGSALIGGSFTGLQSNGALIVGGSFSLLGGIEIGNLAMLSDRASVNPSFRPNPNGRVNALLAIPDGRFLAAGTFTTLAGTTRNRVARFNSDGTLDLAFDPNASGPINAVAIQSDEKYIIGGSFQSVGGQARSNLARLNADGTLDPAFTANPPGAVMALALQSDGKIILAAELANGSSLLGRLNSDGTPDGAVSLGTTTGAIRAISLQADGRILVSGTFAGLGSLSGSRLVRLNPDFTLDSTFNPAPDGAVTALALQSDGRLMIGGNFGHVGGQPRYGLARLAATSSATQSIGVTADRSTVVWTRIGTVGEVAAVLFEQSVDGQNWAMLGSGARVVGTGNWQLGGLALPPSESFFIRARGIAPSSGGVASGVYDTLGDFNFAAMAPSSQTATLADGAAPDSAAGVVSTLFAQQTAAAARDRSIVTFDTAGSASASTVSPAAHLSNLATQARVSADTPLVVGFAIGGTSPRTVLVRAVGPGLTLLDVQNAVAAPQLRLYDNEGRLIVANAGWDASPALTMAFSRAGAFALATGSADAAALATLEPGTYSMQVSNRGGPEGNVLAEVYDASDTTPSSSSRLIHLSTRGVVSVGRSLIGGIVVTGSGAKRLLIRGVGPALAKQEVAGFLSDPVVAVYDAQGRQLAINDDWNASAAELSAAAAQTGACVLASGSKDAALVIQLEKGAYTVQTSGGNGSEGVALLEVYEIF